MCPYSVRVCARARACVLEHQAKIEQLLQWTFATILWSISSDLCLCHIVRHSELNIGNTIPAILYIILRLPSHRFIIQYTIGIYPGLAQLFAVVCAPKFWRNTRNEAYLGTLAYVCTVQCVCVCYHITGSHTFQLWESWRSIYLFLNTRQIFGSLLQCTFATILWSILCHFIEIYIDINTYSMNTGFLTKRISLKIFGANPSQDVLYVKMIELSLGGISHF